VSWYVLCASLAPFSSLSSITVPSTVVRRRGRSTPLFRLKTCALRHTRPRSLAHQRAGRKMQTRGIVPARPWQQHGASCAKSATREMYAVHRYAWWFLRGGCTVQLTRRCLEQVAELRDLAGEPQAPPDAPSPLAQVCDYCCSPPTRAHTHSFTLTHHPGLFVDGHSDQRSQPRTGGPGC